MNSRFRPILLKNSVSAADIDNSEKSDTVPLMQARTRFALDFPIVDILHDEYRLDTDPLAQKIGGSTNEDFLDCRVFSSSSGSLGMH